jgi:hypothetical protein
MPLTGSSVRLKKGDAEMRLTTVRPSIRNMLVTILGFFICFMIIPPSSFADPYWSIGLSGGSAGINGFTLSMGDNCGIPLFIERNGPRYGHAYEGGFPHHMNRPNGYHRNDNRQNQYRQNMSRPNPHVQNYNRPVAYQQNGSRQDQYRQSMSRPNPNIRNYNRPDQYQQNAPLQNQQRQNIDKQIREKQHKWEMSMMNKSMTFPR